MAKYKRVYRVMYEDSEGYRHGKSGGIKYNSKPKGKRTKRGKRK